MDETPAVSKQQAIERLTEHLYRSGCLSDLTQFRTELYRKEAEFSSDIAPNISIPHAKSSAVVRPAIAAMKTADHHTVYVIASDNDENHIRMLSLLADSLL